MFAEHGWSAEARILVRTAPLAPVADGSGAERVVLSRDLDAGWLARYHRAGNREEAARAVLTAGPSVWFATVPDPDGGPEPAAVGRCVVEGRWAMFAAVEIDPARRRQGLATAVMAALARRALDEGATGVFLQVEADNPAAAALYDALGFTAATGTTTGAHPATGRRPDRGGRWPTATRRVPGATGSPPRRGPNGRTWRLLCLLVAAEADPGSAATAEDDVERELDRLAGEIAGLAAGGDGSPESWAAALRAVLGARHGFQGRAADYGGCPPRCCPRCSAGAAGCRSCCRWCGWRRAAGRARRSTGSPCRGTSWSASAIRPAATCWPTPSTAGARCRRTTRPRRPDPAAEPLDVVARVLGNIRVWATGRPERSAVRLWAVELSLLLPRHPARLRLERARLLVERGDFLRGAAELEAYAEVVDILDPDAAATIRRQARAARALLN